MIRRLFGAWAVLTGRAQAVVVEQEDRPPVFFDDRDMAVIEAAAFPEQRQT